MPGAARLTLLLSASSASAALHMSGDIMERSECLKVETQWQQFAFKEANKASEQQRKGSNTALLPWPAFSWVR